MNPLTIFPKHPEAPDTYHIGGAWTPAAIVARDKRFSDAELMACHWEAAYDVSEAEIMGRTGWLKKRLREALTLHRFATRPHYDENPA